MIGRNIEREIAMIVTGSSVWIIICRSVRVRGWRMSSLRAFVSLPTVCCEIGTVGNVRAEMDGEGGDEVGEEMADMSVQSETRERMRRWSSFSSLLRRGC